MLRYGYIPFPHQWNSYIRGVAYYAALSTAVALNKGIY